MSTALHTARTGLQYQEDRLKVKAQNLAAQGVPGYKRQYLLGADLPYQEYIMAGMQTSDTGTNVPTGLQIGSGVKAAGLYRIFKDGDPIKTDNPFDLRIIGDGFFRVQLPDGRIAYTRAGALGPNQSGQLVAQPNGYLVQPNISFPQDTVEVAINEQGEIWVTTQTQDIPQNVGQIELTTFFNPAGLRAIGNNLFTETAASGTPDNGVPMTGKRGKLEQGSLESSNVNAVEEITDLIMTQRSYEMLTKVITTYDAMAGAMVQIRS